jgi:hypothetical protein
VQACGEGRGLGAGRRRNISPYDLRGEPEKALELAQPLPEGGLKVMRPRPAANSDQGCAGEEQLAGLATQQATQ